MDNIDELRESLRVAIQQENERFAQKYTGNESIRWFCDLNKSGKQMRGMLLLLTYYINTQDLEAAKRDALPLAVAVEFMETSLLIQDDTIDMGRCRRKQPTIHEALQAELGMERTDAGVAAHLLGMCGISYALSMLQSYDEVIRDTFYEMLRDTIHGEALDMLAPLHDIDKNLPSDQREELISGIAIWKTAVYSFEVPMYLGYLLSGDSGRDWFRTVGRSLGQMFQIKNDLKALEEVRNGTGMTDITPYRLTAANATAFQLREHLKGLVLRTNKSDADHKTIRNQYPYDEVQKELSSKISKHLESTLTFLRNEPNPFRNRELDLLKKYIEALFV